MGVTNHLLTGMILQVIHVSTGLGTSTAFVATVPGASLETGGVATSTRRLFGVCNKGGAYSSETKMVKKAGFHGEG